MVILDEYDEDVSYRLLSAQVLYIILASDIISVTRSMF